MCHLIVANCRILAADETKPLPKSLCEIKFGAVHQTGRPDNTSEKSGIFIIQVEQKV